MRKLITVLIVAALGWQGYTAYHRASLAAEEPGPEISEEASFEGSDEVADDATEGASSPADATEANFSCDGRTYCSQMTSCEEATWFINHCPGMKTDGNNDGVPCESQWCGR